MLPFNIGFGEMALIGVVAVMLFGSRLPEVASQLGKSYQQFRKGLDEIKSSIKTDLDIDVNSSVDGFHDDAYEQDDDGDLDDDDFSPQPNSFAEPPDSDD